MTNTVLDYRRGKDAAVQRDAHTEADQLCCIMSRQSESIFIQSCLISLTFVYHIGSTTLKTYLLHLPFIFLNNSRVICGSYCPAIKKKAALRELRFPILQGHRAFPLGKWI